ncbi:hypothetical protein Tco_1338177 [Tanacetum coccineum]|uniref:Uncharacterized protein n=1 Tax=Tanacetum coccineum TaxID=301880 RepID=A0ABQ4Z870_9ASTR
MCAIKGVMVDANCWKEPSRVKEEYRLHFAKAAYDSIRWDFLEIRLKFWFPGSNGAPGSGLFTLWKIPRTCSSVADWLRISSGSYAAGGIYHGRPLVHMLIGLIGSIPSD